MLVGTLILEIFAKPICSAFGLSGTTESLCITAIRIISSGLVFAGISIALQGVFQALDCGLSSFIISVCRQLLFILPVARVFTIFIRPDLSNGWLVWLTFPIAEFLTVSVALILMFRTYKSKIQKL